MKKITKKFGLKEIDKEGLDTLDTLAAAGNFNQWMYETIKPFCKGKILEIGSGIGNISQFFLKDGSEIALSDIRENYCRILEKKFSGNKNLLGIQKMDLVLPDFDNVYKNSFEKFDTLFALNVVEHIENDCLAIANAKKLLHKNGTLIILVPAFQILYNRFDEELYHFRRYTKKSLSDLFLKNKFSNLQKMYFNALGMVGWFVSGKVMRKKIIPSSQMSFYNKIVPFAKMLDKLVLKQTGLSVIAVGTK